MVCGITPKPRCCLIIFVTRPFFVHRQNADNVLHSRLNKLIYNHLYIRDPVKRNRTFHRENNFLIIHCDIILYTYIQYTLFPCRVIIMWHYDKTNKIWFAFTVKLQQQQYSQTQVLIATRRSLINHRRRRRFHNDYEWFPFDCIISAVPLHKKMKKIHIPTRRLIKSTGSILYYIVMQVQKKMI